MRKAIGLCAIMALAVMLVAGCGGSGNNAASGTDGGSITAAPADNASGGTGNGDAAGTEKKDITLTYIASQGWIKDAEMQLAKKFEEETGIRIDYQIVPADQYFNVLKTKLNAKEAPDLFGG